MSASRILIAALLCASSSYAVAQNYPSRTARMIVPWTAGGTADLMARIASQKFSESFGQQFVVDNRPGAGGLIGTDQVAKAAPDGYTLLLATTAPNSVAPSLYAKLPFDPVKDFASISLMATTCYVLSVHPSMPVSNARQLVVLAKSRPGQLTFSSPGSGTPNHLSGEMLKMLTGIDMQHVPFKGSAQAISDVIGGQIALSFENIVVASPFVKNGRLKALAVPIVGCVVCAGQVEEKARVGRAEQAQPGRQPLRNEIQAKEHARGARAAPRED